MRRFDRRAFLKSAVAGGAAGAPIRMVRCRTIDLDVPAVELRYPDGAGQRLATAVTAWAPVDILVLNASVRAEILPADKAQAVASLRSGDRRVAMVGDGLNDGPVLASAHVSVALATAVPLAQARSDLVMLGSNLVQLPAMVRRARKTMRVVRHNLVQQIIRAYEDYETAHPQRGEFPGPPRAGSAGGLRIRPDRAGRRQPRRLGGGDLHSGCAPCL